ncbi:MAG: hypothetical protein IID16_13185 [Candidatus Marinimicrobia bacterium]|nr:hypothetical protein [Candidatus Neomarinimicrobiota bacterium]
MSQSWVESIVEKVSKTKSQPARLMSVRRGTKLFLFIDDSYNLGSCSIGVPLGGFACLTADRDLGSLCAYQ